eukprot:CAMPEP_0178926710 /NCGR_PEP_ID=MMETSP0786-20121207/18706_1 /TAXON_ID=186022 /ORGANISM="Thalassionema frauenfeldii, Strain CCMP 1798" /LENGTH=482 /DNA_ID=CAMNT_0020601907 /DNA_START=166 /DNA_END=1614 /DNA_ORIENTATION=+
MPFKRRNLSYWKGIRYNKTKRNQRRKLQQKLDGKNTEKTKKPDLLYSLWKHRVRKYNDAFLKSPRRATRNFSKIVSDEAPAENDGKFEGQKEDSKIQPARPDENNPEADALIESKENICVDGDKDGAGTSDRTMNATKSTLEEDSEVQDGPSHLSYQLSSSMLEEEDANCLTWSDELPPSTVELKTRVVFHFLYLNGDELSIQTDNMKELPRGHRQCPFCYLNCGTDTCLVLHCALCHGEHLRFQAARSEDGSLHIAVTNKVSLAGQLLEKSTDRDFCYIRPLDKSLQRYASVPFVLRTPCKIAEMDTATIRKKTRFLTELGADEFTLQHFIPNNNTPIRQYYHSRSNEPMLEGEWDIDSDEEDDENWLVRMSEELLDEFEDVTASEKCFTKLWNRFIRKHIVTPDLEIPAKCMEFLNVFGPDLVRMELRQELLLHLCGLWDSGLISSSHLSQLMTKFDEIRRSTNVCNEDTGEKDRIENLF